MSSKSPEGREMSSIEKVLEEIRAEKFQSVAKAHKTTDSKSSTNRKQDKLKEMHTQMHHSQTSENKRQRKKSQKQ